METNTVFKTICEYWDNRSFDFDKDHDTEDIQAWMNTIEQLLGKDKNKNVLDLGTGTGFLANMTAKLGYPTLGVDISTEMMRYGVRHAETSGSSAMYMTGNAMALPLMDDTVDNIINARLIWTLVSPDIMLKEWFRVLKPNGQVFCFNRMEDGVGLKSSSGKAFSYDNPEVDVELAVQNASMGELIELMERNGYEDVRIEKLTGLTRPEFDYQSWYVLIGRKPVTKRYRETIWIAEFWDKASSEYEPRHELAHKPVWQEVLAGFVGTNMEAPILDVATGTGIIANMLSGYGYSNVIGLDVSEGMMRIAIDHAREQSNDVRFIYGNAMELPFQDNSADIILNSRLLWTLSEPENAIKEWYRVLRPGGKVIAINELEDEGISCGSMEAYKADTKVSEYPFGSATREQIVQTFNAAGFKNVTINHMPGYHMETSERENWFAFIGTK